jgi:hypothetical protein
MSIKHNPELVAWCVDRFKQLATIRQPKYEQPADSHIERVVKDILDMVETIYRVKEYDGGN